MRNVRQRLALSTVITVLSALGVAWLVHAEPPGDAAKTSRRGEVVAANAARKDRPLSVEAARERAELMHRIYAATLDVLHDRYFHDDRAIVPARAMEDVFSQMEQDANEQARWIAVNTRAMSIGHEPKTDFEKRAAKALADGQEAAELVEDGRYYRAAPISLGAGCVSCHTGFFAKQPKTPRLAGLVISIPVANENNNKTTE